MAEDKLLKHLSFYGILLLATPFLCGRVFAQNVVFIAEATPGRVGVNDRVQLQFTIKDAPHLQSITPPASSDFVVVAGPYQQQSMSRSTSGDKMTQTMVISLTYVLQPKYEGTYTLPPATARDAAGHVYQSNSVSITVGQGTAVQVRHTAAKR